MVILPTLPAAGVVRRVVVRMGDCPDAGPAGAAGGAPAPDYCCRFSYDHQSMTLSAV
jgi:hypothetical protein